MELRKVIIVHNSANRTYELETAAETLAELKADLREARINFEGMSFMEGITKTELLRDDSMLPKDVVRPGTTETTNELVFFLTLANKKIKSGANRLDLYNALTSEMKEHIKATYSGKNYTQVPNSILEGVIDEFTRKVAATTQPVVAGSCPVAKLVAVLQENGYISSAQASYVLSDTASEKKHGSYTQAEIDAIVAGLNV